MKTIYLTKKSRFTASHHHDGSLNEGEHKHIFEYEITLSGKINKEGFLVDFRQVKKHLAEKINKVLGGTSLNTVLPNPTTENVAIWIYETLKPVYKDMMSSVCVYETKDSCITYYGK
ncbi:MAG TPA: 6-carboxytetrahydropterin synthase [Elusimicrobiales bacterium]|nr:6-carboxytetrahydropterin synthase [Elusimicrobiales bacterium]